MPILKDLFLAILAMDSYNRGYSAGIEDPTATGGGLGVTGSTKTFKVGSATIKDVDLPTDSQDAGFYAISYKLDEAVGEGANVLAKDTTIISFRGTDDFNIFNPANDVFKGWVTGVGAWGTDQVRMAAEFYQTVTGTSTSDPRTGSAVLTGHSLGGGLAGLIGNIYGKEAFIFDNMPFELASDRLQSRAALTDADIDALVADFLEPQQAQARQIFEDERAYARDTFFNDLVPWTLNPQQISGQYVTGEALQYARSLGGQVTTVNPVDSHSNDLGAVSLHTMSLLVLSEFADKYADDHWHKIADIMWSSLLNNSIATADGFDPANTNGTAGPSGKMMAALAYSALEGAEGLVFGNTGIRAMFDDLNNFGKFVEPGIESGQSTFKFSSIKNAQGVPISFAQTLSDMIVQYSGALALNKIEKDSVLNANGLGMDITKGIATLNDSKDTFALDFSDLYWHDVLSVGQENPVSIDPIHQSEIIQHFRDQLVNLGVAEAGLPEQDVWDYLVIHNSANAASNESNWDYTPDATKSYHLRAHAIIGGSGHNTIAGGLKDDFIIGGDGGNEFTWTGGEDIFVGGTGNDTYTFDAAVGGTGKGSVFFGGAGEDVADYRKLIRADGKGITLSYGADEALEAGVQQVAVPLGEGEEGIVIDRLYSVEKVLLTKQVDKIEFNPGWESSFRGSLEIDALNDTGVADVLDFRGTLVPVDATTLQFDSVGRINFGGISFTNFEALQDNDKNAEIWNTDEVDPITTGGIASPDPTPEPDISGLIKSVLTEGDFNLDTANNTLKILLGFDYNALGSLDSIYGGGGNDFIAIGDSSGEVRGEAGNDLLIARNAIYVPAVDGVPATGSEPAIAAEAEQRLTLSGGEGDDWLAVLGGRGAELVGGAGRDFLFNTSEYGKTWGDDKGARPLDNPETPENENLGDSDVFWYWPGTFIQDAQTNDILQLFGWPLTGGTNTLTGLPGEDGLAIDWTVWTTFYGYTDSNQLIIYNSLADTLDIGPEGLKGQMIVENFHFGGFQTGGGSGEAAGDGGNIEWGVPKTSDLGMTFRLVLEKDNPNGVEVSVWNAIWGHLITQITALTRLAKLVNWQPADDPLVLDLDGDGIETVAVHQSGVHFDLDGDYFAEKTGWVAADDGFLVRDLNGNGLIDDITEMFGAPGVSAFSELAELDAANDNGCKKRRVA